MSNLFRVKHVPTDQGPGFMMKHTGPDNTHSREKNGGSKQSPLEKAIPPEKKPATVNNIFY